MIQRRDHFGFALEALSEALGGRLDRHVAAEARVARTIHLAHAAFADRPGESRGFRVCRRLKTPSDWK
jgi:hypothetical protein